MTNLVGEHASVLPLSLVIAPETREVGMLLRETPVAAVRALSTPRFEVVPTPGVIEQVAHLPRSTTVTVTCSPTHGIEPTLAVVESLAELGFEAVPHLSARMVRSGDHLDEIVGRLTRAGVQNVYVIGGDARVPRGPFPSAGDLLEALRERGRSFRDVGVAAYPEGHPLVQDERLWEALHEKQPMATYLVTQMCFNAGAITRWIAEARQRGIILPALIGIPGVASKTHLLRIASRIGVGESLHFLSRHSGMLSRLLRPGNYEPDEMIDKLAESMADPYLGIDGFHIYTFNYVTQTENWRQNRLSGIAQ